MREPLVLVDSSIWIHFLRKRTADPPADLLSALLRDKRVATNWVIRLELLSGASTREAYESLDADLAALHQLPLTEKVFYAASLLRWQLHPRIVRGCRVTEPGGALKAIRAGLPSYRTRRVRFFYFTETQRSCRRAIGESGERGIRDDGGRRPYEWRR